MNKNEHTRTAKFHNRNITILQAVGEAIGIIALFGITFFAFLWA